jgi:hypothetical protein
MKAVRFASLAALALLGACHVRSDAETIEAGATVDRSFKIGAFDKIEVSGPYHVAVKTGGAPGVTAHGGANFLDQTEILVENGTLKIRSKKKNLSWSWKGGDSKVRVDVSAAQLAGAAIAGSGDLRIDSVRNAKFEGAVAGSGDLSIDRLEAEAVELSIAGSGKVRAAGKAGTLAMNIAGSGDADLSALEASNADVSIAGSGNVRARATGNADVSILGSGDVDLTGGAKCKVSKQGSGDVRCS